MEIDYGAHLQDLEFIYDKLGDEYDKDTISFTIFLVHRLQQLEAMVQKSGSVLQ